MSVARILVAGVGNIFLGDDAFGVEVVGRLAARALPSEVQVIDFGIRGIDLTYKLMDGWDAVILVDAVARGMAPGTVYTIETETPDSGANGQSPMPLIEAHNLDPARVLHLAKSLGGEVGRVLLVGCEPTPIDPEQDFQMQLSPPVAAAVDVAANTVVSLVDRILSGETMTKDFGQSEGVALCQDLQS